MHIDKETGLAPASWQSQVGSCLFARKDKEPMTEELFWEMHNYMSYLLDMWERERDDLRRQSGMIEERLRSLVRTGGRRRGVGTIDAGLIKMPFWKPLELLTTGGDALSLGTADAEAFAASAQLTSIPCLRRANSLFHAAGTRE